MQEERFHIDRAAAENFAFCSQRIRADPRAADRNFSQAAEIRVKLLWTDHGRFVLQRPVPMPVSLQCEFQLRVPVCAWCQPKSRGVELGAGLGAISHGICPRHLKKLRLELQQRKEAGQAVHPAAAHSARRKAVSNHPELKYHF